VLVAGDHGIVAEELRLVWHKNSETFNLKSTAELVLFAVKHHLISS